MDDGTVLEDDGPPDRRARARKPRGGEARTSSSRRLSQDLGRKGGRTRRSLLAAAGELVKTTSPVALTAAAISRHANASPTTFYAYFDSVSEVVRELALAASCDLDEVLEVLRQWRAGLDAKTGAAAFVEAFRAHWEQYRAILNIRNLEADRGDPLFLAMRTRAAEVVIADIAELILGGGGAGASLSQREARARAIVVYAAVERLAATELLYPPPEPHMPTRLEVVDAQVAILVQLIGPIR